MVEVRRRDHRVVPTAGGAVHYQHHRHGNDSDQLLLLASRFIPAAPPSLLRRPSQPQISSTVTPNNFGLVGGFGVRDSNG
ncbi:hypothetical protein Vadar_002365 [Vaccinium darrowii]|uniref:Uncharacterized protein n=1 Tax=Vaccinium darrowii TaxID=229202 RepID=A0ACB7XWZ4_9ERIC|nr:hypothetical protein Vadar_002365 [Vaccinium darrowii]